MTDVIVTCGVSGIPIKQGDEICVIPLVPSGGEGVGAFVNYSPIVFPLVGVFDDLSFTGVSLDPRNEGIFDLLEEFCPNDTDLFSPSENGKAEGFVFMVILKNVYDRMVRFAKENPKVGSKLPSVISRIKTTPHFFRQYRASSDPDLEDIDYSELSSSFLRAHFSPFMPYILGTFNLYEKAEISEYFITKLVNFMRFVSQMNNLHLNLSSYRVIHDPTEYYEYLHFYFYSSFFEILKLKRAQKGEALQA